MARIFRRLLEQRRCLKKITLTEPLTHSRRQASKSFNGKRTEWAFKAKCLNFIALVSGHSAASSFRLIALRGCITPIDFRPDEVRHQRLASLLGRSGAIFKVLERVD